MIMNLFQKNKREKKKKNEKINYNLNILKSKALIDMNLNL